MAFGKVTKLGLGTAVLAFAGMAGVGFAPAPTELPTVTVWHNPT